MEPRLNLAASPLAAKAMKYFVSTNKVIIENSTLPKSTQELVMLLISLINASTRMGVITRLQGGGYQPGQFA